MTRLTTMGKQVKLDGEHLADACSPEAAEAIAVALEYASTDHVPRKRAEVLRSLLA